MRRGPLIIAHRGDSTHAPENTLAAFRLARAAGADGVEFDVRLARDGVPVVIHDATLARTATRRKRVCELTSGELSEVDAGSWFNRGYPGHHRDEFAAEGVPTLAEVLHVLSASTERIYIELKAESDEAGMELTAAVAAVIRGSPLMPAMIVKSFDLGLLPEVSSLLPSVATAALFGPGARHLVRRRRLVDLARDAGAGHISVHRALASRGLVRYATELGMTVTVWTCDQPAWVDRCRRLGIAAVITNDPAAMLARRAAIG